MTSIRPALAALAILVLLGGCGAVETASLIWNGAKMLTLDTAEWQPGDPIVRTRAEPVELRHRVGFEPGGVALTTAAQARLDAFLGQAAIRPYETITTTAMEGALAAGRIETLTAMLAARGLSMVPSRAPATEDENGADWITLRVARDVVIAPDCFAPRPEGRQRPIFIRGCTNEVILGEMVANPADLRRGRSPGPADGEAAARAIERYRTGQTTPLIEQPTTGESQ